MPRPSTSSAALSPHWAFVVQLREGTPLVAERLSGRAEHIVSGEVAYFESVAQLLAFIERVLDCPEPAPPTAPGYHHS